MQEGATSEGVTPSGGVIGAPGLWWTLVVLTGGSSRRMGRDKATAELGEATLLEHVLLGARPPQGRVVIVGEPPPAAATAALAEPPIVCREDPPGGGPAAAVVAALPHVDTPLMGLIATDMPFAAPLLEDLIEVLAAQPHLDAVIPCDSVGHRQPLAAAYRSAALRAGAADRGLHAAPLRDLIATLTTREIAVPAGTTWRLRDLDTPADLAWAQAQPLPAAVRPTGAVPRQAGILHRDERITMDKTTAWVSTAAQALGIEGDVDTQTVLDVARDVAHGVERPAAPLTTYLLGVAVGRGADPVEAAATIRSLLDDAGA